MLKTFAELSTPFVADPCVRSDVPLRAAPPGSGGGRGGRVGRPGAVGGCTAIRRSSRRSAFRCSATAATRPGPCGWTSGSPEALASARFGPHLLSADDVVFGDDDGVLFAAAERADEVLTMAHRIWQTEREQARRIRAGATLRRQTAVDDYPAQRAANPSQTFRRVTRVACDEPLRPVVMAAPSPSLIRVPRHRCLATRTRDRGHGVNP